MDQNTGMHSSQAKTRGASESGRSQRTPQAKPHRGNQRQQGGHPSASGQGGPTVYWSNGNTASSDRGGRGRGRGSRGGSSTRGRGGGITDEMMELNFENIRRMDPNIKSIIDHSSQVAIFTYTNDQWNEALAVGSLFMYERSAQDRLGMVIMNRQSVENWIHTVTKKFELVVEPPYWLVKDSDSIFCIWFYDSNDIIKLATIFMRFQHSVIVKEGGNKMDSGLKPPNLLAAAGTQRTGETLGDAIMAMLSKSKTDPTDETTARAMGTNLLNLIAKPDPTKAEDSVAHPLPIKPEPMSPQQAFKQSPKSKVQLRTPGASSFAEVAARPKKDKELKSAPGTEQKIEKPRVRKGDEVEATSFTMQTVEQLEKENQKEKQEGPNLGGHGFLTHEHLAQHPSPQPEKSHQKMTNELRAKLGLPPCLYSVSPDDDTAALQYYPNVIDDAIESIPNFTSQDDSRFSASQELPWLNAMQLSSTKSAEKAQQQGSLSGFGISDKQRHAGINQTGLPEQQMSPIKANVDKNLRFRTIEDIHGKEISEVEPHELEYVLTTHAEQAKNLKLMPQPGGANGTRLVWTNVAREHEHELTHHLPPPAYSVQAASGILNLGAPAQDLPLTADQLVKTFKLLLHDKEFVTKFHNAYLQVRSEEGD